MGCRLGLRQPRRRLLAAAGRRSTRGSTRRLRRRAVPAGRSARRRGSLSSLLDTEPRIRPTSPYKGLAPFQDSELDELLFFGREQEREVIVANIIAARLTILYGPSG